MYLNKNFYPREDDVKFRAESDFLKILDKSYSKTSKLSPVHCLDIKTKIVRM